MPGVEAGGRRASDPNAKRYDRRWAFIASSPDETLEWTYPIVFVDVDVHVDVDVDVPLKGQEFGELL